MMQMKYIDIAKIEAARRGQVSCQLVVVCPSAASNS